MSKMPHRMPKMELTATIPTLEPPIFSETSLTGDSQDFDPPAGVRCERALDADRSGSVLRSAQPRARLVLSYYTFIFHRFLIPRPLHNPYLDLRFPFPHHSSLITSQLVHCPSNITDSDAFSFGRSNSRTLRSFPLTFSLIFHTFLRSSRPPVATDVCI